MKYPAALPRIIAAILFLALSSSFSIAAEFTVDKTFDGIDDNPGDGICATASGSCTLRAAVMETNALAGPDVIKIKPGTYKLALGTAGDDDAASGDLDISDDLTIVGEDRDAVILSGNANRFRIFQVLDLPVSVRFENLTLTEGRAATAGSVVFSEGELLELKNVLLTNASDDHRDTTAIYQINGQAIVNDSEFHNNNEVLWLNGASAEIDNSIFSKNKDISVAITGSSKIVTINNSIFTENTNIAPVYSNARNVAVYINSSTFENNISRGNGGGN